MKLDATTLFFSMFVNVTLMFCALCVGVKWKESSGIRYWAVELLLQAVAWASLMAAYQGWPREFATLGTAAMVAGFGFVHVAATSYLQLSYSRVWVIGIPVVTTVLHWLVFDNFAARIGIVNAALAVQMLRVAWLHTRRDAVGSWRWRWLGAVALSASGVMVAGRAALVVIAPESYPRFESAHWINIVGLIVSNACLMVGTLSFLLAHREEAERELQRLATTDGLTGVLNRRRWMEQAQSHFQLARRHGRSLAVAMLDIDFFKRINDTHGHQAGDRALVLFAQALQHLVRLPDLVGRYGGEEFCVLLPLSGASAAQTVDERMRAATHEVSAALGFELTFSAGVASLQEGDATLDQVIARADQALYAAKQGGRNRLEFA
ncbi:MAG: GGDEF domain-containing protein [Rhizobacter sp.]|nr:GGDEF domain-containing protein [Rhizobacter sp.]